MPDKGKVSLPQSSAKPNHRKTMNWQAVALIGTTALVLYLVVGPLVITLLSTFTQRGKLPLEGTFTLHNYAVAFVDPAIWKVMINTLIFAIGSIALGGSISITFSWLLDRSDLPYRNLIFAAIIAPMAIPGLLSAISWVFLLDQRMGLVNIILRGLTGSGAVKGPINVYSLGGMIFVEGIRMVPTIFLMISGAFHSMDPSLEEASRTSGKSLMVTIKRITLPLMWPAILAALLYYFVVAIESFEIPGVLGMNAGIQLFSTSIFWLVNSATSGLPNYGLASTLSLILIAISVLLITCYNYVTKNMKNFVTITGKDFRSKRARIGKWKYPVLLVFGVYFLISLALPMFILLWASLHQFYLPPSLAGLKSLSLKSYVALFNYPRIGLAVVNTVVISVCTASATMVLAFLVGWFKTRERSRLSKFLDVLAFLPHALPSIVMALAVLLLYLSFPNPFYGTIVVIGIAMTTRYLSYGSRAMSASFIQVHPELEEASRISGAGWASTCRRIILPLVAPVFINAWIWVTIMAAREVSISVMLMTPSSVLISSQVWNFWETGRAPVASALGVILVLFLLMINWIGRSVLSRVRSF